MKMQQRSLRVILSAFVLVGGLAATGKAAAQDLVAAVLPASRAIQVGATATAFATIINPTNAQVSGCSIALPSGIPATLTYQTTNPTTNAVTGTPNRPVSIPAGGSQTFVFAVTPNAAFSQTDIPLVFNCTTGGSVRPISGVNTFLLTASSTPTPDIVALAATVSNDGVVRTPGTTASAAFSVATINVGAAGTVTASVDTGGASVPMTFTLCETNAQAQCQQTPAASVGTSFTANQAKTFSIFVTATGTNVQLDPARTRAYVRFRTAAGSVGATSVAAETQVTLSISGGTLQFGDVAVQAPEGAAFTGVDFRVSRTTPPSAPLPAGLNAVPNAVFDISAGSPVAGTPDGGLNAPVLLTLPVSLPSGTDPGLVQVLRFNSATNAYEPTSVHDVDTQAGRITFDTRQFSSFLVSIINAAAGLPASFNTQFNPAQHGFSIQNFGGFLSPNGTCLGMASFATWYYTNGARNLASRFTVPAGTSTPNSIPGLLALRAHIAQHSQWYRYYSSETSFRVQALSQAAAATTIRYWLATQRRPLILIAGTSSGWQHALVATRYDGERLYFYDPNYPGQERSVTYGATGFGTYDGYTRFAAIGSPSFSGPDTFSQILRDAEGGFATSQQITITSPTQGQTVSSRQVQLTGSLNASLNANRGNAWLNGTGIRSFSLSNRQFNATMDVASGPNTILVIAGVQDGDSRNFHHGLANSAVRVVQFQGPPSARFRSTLAWGQSNTDVDLYVIEPTGQAAWYQSTSTAGGLRLDFDNTTGFGPENITLENAAPIPGNYRVRVHHYRGGAVSGRVEIVLNERSTATEGAMRMQQVRREFAISVANSGNAQPTATGADWREIALVDIANGTITLP